MHTDSNISNQLRCIASLRNILMDSHVFEKAMWQANPAYIYYNKPSIHLLQLITFVSKADFSVQIVVWEERDRITIYLLVKIKISSLIHVFTLQAWFQRSLHECQLSLSGVVCLSKYDRCTKIIAGKWTYTWCLCWAEMVLSHHQFTITRRQCACKKTECE